MAENAQPIIVKKVKKVSGGGHHGGSWKVAYADFVTAMMAFFLLLWLLNVSDPETLRGISDFFQSPSIVHAAGGSSTSIIKIGSQLEAARGEGTQMRDSDDSQTESSYSEEFLEQEMRQMEQLKEEIEDVIEETPALQSFKDQLLLDITSEGLRLQIVDKDRRPMFDLGSSILKPYARKILRELAPVLNQVPNKISMSGHTDARKFFGRNGYSNWELSSERANASRRELIRGGYPANKIARVVGLASRVLFDKEKPLNPINRRISIIVLNKKAEDAIYADEGMDAGIRAIPGILPEELKEAIRTGNVERSGTIQR